MAGGTYTQHPTLATGVAGTLTPQLLDQLQAEAKARRSSPQKLLAELLEDLADLRAVERSERLSRGKPNVSLAQVKARLGL